MSGPLVSILIPAYNSAPWIREAVKSAYLQTWPAKEIVIVDDGSTDDTLSLAHAMADQLPRRHQIIRVIHQNNRGAASARNLAFKHCQGDYIQWLDADDMLERDKIEQQIRAIGSFELGPQTLISGAWAWFRYRKSQATFHRTALWSHKTPVEWLSTKLSRNYHMQPANWLVSRELTESAGPWDEKLTHDDDGEYFARVLTKSSGTHFVQEAKSYYRSAGFQSLSHVAANSKKLESLHRSMRLHIDYLLGLENSQRTRGACLIYIRNWLHEFYPYRPDLVKDFKNLTHDLGGWFEEPRLSAKYQWIVKRFGWAAARKAQIALPRIRGSLAIGWDRLLWQIGIP